MNTRLLAAALVVGATFAGCEPAVASTTTAGSAAGAAVGAQVAPHDVTCTKTGTLWTCRHGATGNVEFQMQDYANCIVESDCQPQWINGTGSGTGDWRFFLMGTD